MGFIERFIEEYQILALTLGVIAVWFIFFVRSHRRSLGAAISAIALLFILAMIAFWQTFSGRDVLLAFIALIIGCIAALSLSTRNDRDSE